MSVTLELPRSVSNMKSIFIPKYVFKHSRIAKTQAIAAIPKQGSILREDIGLDFVNFGSKTYIELFTYLCRQIIKLALYTHLNSAKKVFCYKSQFCGMPHRSKVIVLVK